MLHLNIAIAFLLYLFSCWPLPLDLCQGLGNFLLCSVLTAACLLVNRQGYWGRGTGAAMGDCKRTLAWEHCTDLALSFVLPSPSVSVTAIPLIQEHWEVFGKHHSNLQGYIKEGAGKTSSLPADRIALSLRKQKPEFIWVIDLSVRVLCAWVHSISCQQTLGQGDLWLLLICSQDVNPIKGGQGTV